ncbi:MAG: ABC transporter ATP-binding protein [Actinomycetota bacterium]
MPKRPEAGRSYNGALLEVRDLDVHFSLRGSFFDRLVGREAGSVKAVDGVSFDLRKGEVLGVVGESGSGKTTLGRAILHLVEPTAGSVSFEGREVSGLGQGDTRRLRRRMQIVFQDPHASLNPAMDLETAIGHPLVIHGVTTDKDEIRKRVARALERVGLTPPEQYLTKYPSDLSGGQKQRAVLARAVILGPDLLVADEPVSMLDMSVRAKILELMLELKRDLDLTYLYITHDLATAKFFCDRIAIMYLGKIVEIGPSKAIYADPKHPYTESLLKAIPEPDPLKTVPRDLPRGGVPDAVNPPLGCSFHPRCPRAFEVCGWEARDLRDILEERWAHMDSGRYEPEREVIGDLDALDVVATSVDVPAGSGHRGKDIVALFDRMRSEDPDEPLWKGVREVAAGDGHATVHFHEPVDPRLLPEGDVEVSCHLHDEEARARAEEYARSGPAAVSP